MHNYSNFVNQLEVHLKTYKTAPADQWERESVRFVDGLAETELRRLVDIGERRDFGAFFTNSKLALKVISNSNVVFGSNCTIYDPAVGAGNLLLASYNFIRNKTTQLELLGTDLHPEFIKAAHLRIAINNLLSANPLNVQPVVNLSVLNGLADNPYYKRATHIITNPPFNLMYGSEIDWGSGKVSAAAVFIDRIIRFIRPNTPVIAILPDVLRSGSRYEKWRTMVEEHCTISQLTMLGQFDKHADVDVFSVVLTKKAFPQRSPTGYIWTVNKKANKTIDDLFNVSVGNVVDNRDPKKGALRPFFVSKGLAGWQVLTQTNRTRRFNGRSVSGPFVVIKRTSRMGNQHRAVASIINSPCPVYVDNHLIVLKPKSGRLSDCQSLIEKLKSDKTDNWLNEQIRCRHLTVKIVAKIPL